MPYAEKTEVPVVKTKHEIEALLERQGATAVITGFDMEKQVGIVQYRMKGKYVKHYLTMPTRDDFHHLSNGLRRAETSIDKMWDQAKRSRWRQFLLVLRAKFVAIESGITTFEEEFLAHVMLSDGTTIGQTAIPQLEEHYRSGAMPAMTGPQKG